MLLLASLLAASAPPTTPPDGALLFRQVCLEGEASFAPDKLIRIKSGEIPVSARFLLEHLESADRHSMRTEKFSSTDIPSSAFLLLGTPRSYLIVPDIGAEVGSKSLCAIFTEEDQYVDALRMLSNYMNAGKPGADSGFIGADKDYADQVSNTMYLKHHSVTVARDDDWTMIAAARVPVAAK